MTAEEIKNFILASIISADNDRYSEEIKQDIIQRIKDKRDDLEYVLEPLGDDAHKYIELIRAA